MIQVELDSAVDQYNETLQQLQNDIGYLYEMRKHVGWFISSALQDLIYGFEDCPADLLDLRCTAWRSYGDFFDIESSIGLDFGPSLRIPRGRHPVASLIDRQLGTVDVRSTVMPALGTPRYPDMVCTDSHAAIAIGTTFGKASAVAAISGLLVAAARGTALRLCIGQEDSSGENIAATPALLVLAGPMERSATTLQGAQGLLTFIGAAKASTIDPVEMVSIVRLATGRVRGAWRLVRTISARTHVLSLRMHERLIEVRHPFAGDSRLQGHEPQPASLETLSVAQRESLASFVDQARSFFSLMNQIV